MAESEGKNAVRVLERGWRLADGLGNEVKTRAQTWKFIQHLAKLSSHLTIALWLNGA